MVYGVSVGTCRATRKRAGSRGELETESWGGTLTTAGAAVGGYVVSVWPRRVASSAPQACLACGSSQSERELTQSRCVQVGVLRVLEQFGTNLTLRNRSGSTPLHTAAKYGAGEAMTTLVRFFFPTRIPLRIVESDGIAFVNLPDDQGKHLIASLLRCHLPQRLTSRSCCPLHSHPTHRSSGRKTDGRSRADA